MKATIDDLKRYAYCPKFFEQQGPLTSIHDDSREDFTKLLTYLFRRDLETETKQGWKVTENRWNKIFFARHDTSESSLRAYNRSLVAIKKFYTWYLEQPTTVVAVNYTLSSVVYDHQLIGDVPVLIAGSKGITMITTEPLKTLNSVMLDPSIRYLAMALDEELTVEGIQNVSLIDYQIFHEESFIPKERYFELAVLDFVNLMTAMQSNFSFPNTLSCSTCPIAMVCEAMKGNV